VSYEVTDPTIDSQIITLRSGNADVLISGVTARFAAQSIRKVFELDWKPMHFVTSGASSVSSVIMPVGPERALGLITSTYIKDPSDPAWADDAGMKDYMAFMAKYFGDGNPKEFLNAYGYTVTSVLRKLLEQCNGNFSRDSIMAQANNLRNLEVPTLLPGVRVNTSPTNHHPLRQMAAGTSVLILRRRPCAVSKDELLYRSWFETRAKSAPLTMKTTEGTENDHALSLPCRALVPAGVDAGRDGSSV
jgi:branched-chain amino acid transport system substrate-binding protein